MLNLFYSFIDDFLNCHIRTEKSADSLHKKREHTYSQKFNEHLKHVLLWGVTFVVTITNCSKGGYNPIYGCYVHGGVIRNVNSWTFTAIRNIFMTLLQPRAFNQLADADPSAPNEVAC